MKPFFQRFIKAIRDETERPRWEEDLVDKFNEVYSGVSPEGGILSVLTNKTGAPSIKGQLVEASTAVDMAFQVATTSGFTCIGAVYDAGVPDGSPCRIVVGGVADVLMVNGTSATRGNWAGASTAVGGRALLSGTVPSPPNADSHFREIGHVIQTVSSGTDQLAKIILHFN